MRTMDATRRPGSTTSLESPFLVLQQLPRTSEIALLRLLDPRELEIERPESIDDRGGHDQSREPFVVGRHDEPGGVAGGGASNRILVRIHVVVPAVALAQIGDRELPVLLGPVETLQKP